MICVYRVSTVGQVDHDDIPMQRIACRDYAASHPDWEIVDEISEKGVSGYKVAANDRDAIVEIKKKAIKGEFDVLLVFSYRRNVPCRRVHFVPPGGANKKEESP